MKKKISEAIYSLFAIFLFACGFAALLLAGIVMIPLLLVALFIIALKKLIRWRKYSGKAVKQMPARQLHQRTTIIRAGRFHSTKKQAA